MARALVGREGRVTPGRVWLAWVAANILPSFVVSALILAIRPAVGIDGTAVLAYVVLFALISVLQARVWTRWCGARGTWPPARPGRWIAWTIGGLGVAMFFGVGTVATLDGLGHERLGLVIGWAIAGVVLGSAQAAALGVSIGRAVSWVAATLAGWAGAAVAYAELATASAWLTRVPVVRWLVGGLALEGNAELVITAVTFAAYGILTGALLARLTPRREAGA